MHESFALQPILRLKYSVGPDPWKSCAQVKSALLQAIRANDLPLAGNGMCFCAVQRNPLLERYSFFFQPGSRRARFFRGFQFGFPILHQFCRAYSPRAFRMGRRPPCRQWAIPFCQRCASVPASLPGPPDRFLRLSGPFPRSSGSTCRPCQHLPVLPSGLGCTRQV